MLLHLYIYLYKNNNAKAEIFSLQGNLSFTYKNNSFHDAVISLVQEWKVLQRALSFPFHTYP